MNPKRMTVLHCFDSYLPNTENWAYRLVKHQHGIRKFVTAYRFLDNNFFSHDVQYLRFPVSELNCPESNSTLWVRIWNSLVGRLRPIHPWFLAKFLKDVRVDIVHSHFGYVGWEYRKLAKALGAKHIVSFYGWDYEYFPKRYPIWENRYRQLFAEADLFLCEGEYAAALLRKRGCPAEKIAISRLGVECEKIPFYERKKGESGLQLLQIASFREKKGHIYALRALAAVRKHCPGVNLTLVGSGTEEAEARLKEEIERLGIVDCVRIEPPLAFEDLHAFMKDYDIFIHPSCHAVDGDCEGGAPVVLLDAQATGLPIIATRHCDIPGEVVENKTGLLTEEEDVDGLVAAIIKIAGMANIDYENMRREARRYVYDNFDCTYVVGQMIKLYWDLLRFHRRELL